MCRTTRAQRQGVISNLADRITNIDKNHLRGGVLGVGLLLRTLAKNGCNELAYAIATQKTYPGWGFMLAEGATTFWETWMGPCNPESKTLSWNHPMLIGDLAIWMYEHVAGIQPDSAHPGFEHVFIRPDPVGDLTWVKAHYDSIRGRIVSEWERKDGCFSLHVVIPPNCTATVILPAKSSTGVKDGGVSIATAPGVKVLEPCGDGVRLEIGSGDYRFELQAN